MVHRTARTATLHRAGVLSGTERGPVLDTDAVHGFLAEQQVDLAGDLHAELIPGGRSNLTFRVTDGMHQWVLRQPPHGVSVPSAHNIVREFEVQRALEGSAVPVAPTVALCRDSSVIGSPFSVVEFVDGVVIRTEAELCKLGDDEVLGCSDCLIAGVANLHHVDFRGIGLAALARPRPYAERQLRRWSERWRSSSSSGTSRLAHRLQRQLSTSIPEEERVALVHGDYRIDNTIIDSNGFSKIRAIVDWELAAVGDPVADVAMMCAYRHPALNMILGVTAAWTSKRIPSVEELAESYEAVSGIHLRYWEFFLSLAYFRLAGIAQSIDDRYRSGATVGNGFETASEAVAPLLETGLACIA